MSKLYVQASYHTDRAFWSLPGDRHGEAKLIPLSFNNEGSVALVGNYEGTTNDRHLYAAVMLKYKYNVKGDIVVYNYKGYLITSSNVLEAIQKKHGHTDIGIDCGTDEWAIMGGSVIEVKDWDKAKEGRI